MRIALAYGVYGIPGAERVIDEGIVRRKIHASVREYIVFVEIGRYATGKGGFKVRIPRHYIERIIVGSDGLQLIQAGLGSAPVIIEVQVTRLGELVGKGSFGIPVEETPFLQGVLVYIVLVVIGVSQVRPQGIGIFFSGFLEKSASCIGQDIQVVEIAEGRIQDLVFPPVIPVVGIFVGSPAEEV